MLIQLVCKEGLPLSLVESSAFKAFVHELDPRYLLPTRQALSHKLIPESYDRTKTKLKTSLTQSQSQSITTDMWTSASNQSFMGVTAHWLTDDFSMQSKCLAVQPAPGSHTADFISAELSSVCSEWDIDVGRLHVITDSGSNVKKAVTQLMQVEKWRPCFAHTLQLCVNASLNSREVSELPKVLAKARTIVGHFRRSPLASSHLDKAQQQLNLPRHKLMQDCPTRWNSQVTRDRHKQTHTCTQETRQKLDLNE